MPRLQCVVLALLLLHLTPSPTPTAVAPPSLAWRIESVLQRPEYHGARWGILVVDQDTGEVIYAHNPDQLFAPASVTKLFSSAAALIALGADHVFETPVYRRGEVLDGRLDGDLILVAQGDLTLGGRTTAEGSMAFTNHDHIYFTSTDQNTHLTNTNPLAGLQSLAKQVKASGIREVRGDVLLDERLFDRARGSGSGPDLVTPILVNDNLVDVILTPGAKPGAPVRHTLRPNTDYLQVDVQVETSSAKRSPLVTVEQVGPQRYVVRGSIPVGSQPVVRTCKVDDPAGFARALFLDCLRQEGVHIRASALRTPSGPLTSLPERDGYGKLTRVALYRSPPLSEAIKVILKVSHNLYSSTLPLILATKNGQRTLQQGMLEQGRILSRLGVDIKRISLESGAGGGNGDRVSPRATVALLRAMAQRSDWEVFRQALPRLGVDGTLVDVGITSPARGQVWAKTGTYSDSDLLNGRWYLRSKSLAGVMTTAQGRKLAFALFVNDVPLPLGVRPTREGQVLGNLCEILHESVHNYRR